MSQDINRAMLVYLGVRQGHSLDSGRDAVTAAFGHALGGTLLQQIEQILSGVEYTPGDTLPQPTLDESWAVNEEALRRAHPELDDDVLGAIRSDFFYSNR